MIFIYVSCQNLDTAQNIAETLVEKRMAVSVDIMAIQSVHRQENGGVAVNPGAAMIIKTVEKHIQSVEDIVKEYYHDGIPCIATISLNRLNNEFKDWLSAF